VRRYGALLAFSGGIAVFAGYGVLERRAPDEDAAIPGTLAARNRATNTKADCIVLDSGDVIWASECVLFAQKDEMVPHLEKADRVKNASITDVRAKRRAEVEAQRSSHRPVRPKVDEATEDEKRAEAAERERSESERLAKHTQLRNTKLSELLKSNSRTQPSRRGRQGNGRKLPVESHSCWVSEGVKAAVRSHGSMSSPSKPPGVPE
jgi:hypothetical protein